MESIELEPCEATVKASTWDLHVGRVIAHAGRIVAKVRPETLRCYGMYVSTQTG